MIQHIHKLRARPNHEKKRIAFVVSAGITAIIFVFWIASFNPSTGASDNNSGVANVVSPFESIKNNVASAYDSVFNSAADATKKEIQVEVVPGDKSGSVTK